MVKSFWVRIFFNEPAGIAWALLLTPRESRGSRTANAIPKEFVNGYTGGITYW